MANTRTVVGFAFAFVPVVLTTSVSEAWRTWAYVLSDEKHGEPCAPCLWESDGDSHVWFPESLCDTEEERKENGDCSIQSGEHSSHNGGSGTCPGQACDIETLAALGIGQQLLLEMDLARAAALIRIGVAEVNHDRSVLQVLGCGESVIAQVVWAPGVLAELERVAAFGMLDSEETAASR